MLNIYKTVLSNKTQLNSDTYLYQFNLLEPKEIEFKAGQYLMLKIPTDRGPISRLYSIATSPSIKNSFDLIIQIIPGGLASTYLSKHEVNDEITFQGPAGRFELKDNDRQKVFLVTGTGIAPILSMIKSNFLPIKSGFNYQLFWGMKNYKDVYFLNELQQLSNGTMKQFKICLSREQNLDMIPEEDKKYFALGHVDSCLEQLVPSPYSLISNSDFYLCGARQIVESLRLFLLAKGILLKNIHFEKF